MTRIQIKAHKNWINETAMVTVYHCEAGQLMASVYAAGAAADDWV